MRKVKINLHGSPLEFGLSDEEITRLHEADQLRLRSNWRESIKALNAAARKPVPARIRPIPTAQTAFVIGLSAGVIVGGTFCLWLFQQGALWRP